MNYEDELERVRAQRSRRRQSRAAVARTADAGQAQRLGFSGGTETAGRSRSRKNSAARSQETEGQEIWTSTADPGSRAGRSQASGGGISGGNGGSGYGGSHVSGYRGPRKRKKPENKKKKIIIRVVIAVVLILAAAVFGAWYYVHSLFAGANDNEIDQTKVEGSINLNQEVREEIEKGYWTFAVFGVDSRDGSTGSGNQADVIMIVNVNRETGEIKLVSVFRDTYLNISEKNSYNKINAAYAQGGPEQAMMALNKNLDLSITQYATFNWTAVATGINILGGIDIDISKSEFYYINAFITETVKGTGIGSVQLKSAGLNHLDGVQAVAYGRLRLMDTDYARTERQRLVIAKAFEKAKQADIATLNSLVGNMFALCATNINEMDILKMVGNVNKYHLGETMGFPAARGEQKIKIGKYNQDCVIPQTLESNVKSLHEFLYGAEDYTPSSTVLSISSKLSEITGLYKEGQEIGHVPTDKGYIPKSTTAAAPATTAAETESETELEQSSEGESSSGESTGETTESGGILLGPGETLPSIVQTDENGEIIVPSSPYPGSSPAYEPSSSGQYRPSSPADMATMHTTEGYGPGSDPTTAAVPEATTAPSGVTSPTSGSSSSVIISPTTAASPTTSASPAGQTSPAAPTSSASPTAPTSPTASSPQEIVQGSGGPASTATSGAAEVPGAGA